jgi:hypothetical protein
MRKCETTCGRSSVLQKKSEGCYQNQGAIEESEMRTAHRNEKVKHNKMKSTELIEDAGKGDLRRCWESMPGLGELERRKGTQKSTQTTQMP